MSNTTIRTLVLEYVDKNGASHIHEMHIEVLQRRPNTPEHTIRARLSEAVNDGILNRLGRGFYDIYAEEADMTSVVSYPVPMEGSGTSRDVVEGLNKYKKKGISYWGGDLRNGFDLTKQQLPGKFDFCWIHPPYWNIIRYSDDPNDLSSYEDYEQFRKFLMICLQRCFEALETGGRLAVLIGDVRRKGKYTPIVKDVLNFPRGELRSIIIKVQHNCTSDRRAYGKLEDPPIKHEYCIIFRKTASSNEPGRQRFSPEQLEIEEAIGAVKLAE